LDVRSNRDPWSKAPLKITQSHPLGPRYSPYDIIKQCIDPFTMIDN
jgi:hypothetical protein